MKKLLSFFLIISVLIVSFAFPVQMNAWVQYPNTCTQFRGTYNSAFENQIANLVIQYKANQGMNVYRNQYFENSSNHKLELLRQSQQWSHDIWGRSWMSIHGDCGLYPSIGENLARGYNSGYETFNAWLNSPTHKAILDARWIRYFGISCGYNVFGSETVCVLVTSD